MKILYILFMILFVATPTVTFSDPIPIGPGNASVIGPGGAGGGGSGPTPPIPCTDGALQYNVSCNVIFMTGIFQ